MIMAFKKEKKSELVRRMEEFTEKASAPWRSHGISYPAIESTSFVVKQLQHQVTNILKMTVEREIVIANMVYVAKALPNFKILLSIPGIADNTAVRLIGELGDS